MRSKPYLYISLACILVGLFSATAWADQIILKDGTVYSGKFVRGDSGMIDFRILGRISGQPQLILELTDLVADGRSFMVRTSDYQEVGASRGRRTAATVGGTAALGAIIGAIAGGGTGAAVGAASGAAVGTGVQVLTKGEVLRIPAETILEFKLESVLKAEIP